MSDTKNAEEYINKIIQACEDHDHSKAIEYAKELERLNPSNDFFLKELNAFSGCGYSKAIDSKITELYSKLTRKGVDNEIREAAYEIAAEYFDDLDVWLEFLEEFPENDEAFDGIYNFARKKFKDVKKAFSQRVKESPKNQVFRAKYAKFLERNSCYKEAIEQYELVVTSNSNYIPAYNNLAILLLKQNVDIGRAEILLKKALDYEPNSHTVSGNLGILYEDAERYDLAKDCYKKAIDLGSADSEIQLRLANLYIYDKEINKAEKLYQSILIKDRSNYLVNYYYANFLWLDKGDYKSAEKKFIQAIKENNSFFEAHRNIAALYFEDIKNNEKAKFHFLKAIELDRESDISRKGLGEVSQFQKSTFISELEIKKVRHLRNINIKLDKEKRKHLFFTGKNGSGKTSVLLQAKEYLEKILEMPVDDIFTDVGKREFFTSSEDYKLKFNVKTDLLTLRLKYETGNFIVAYFPARRKLSLQALERPAKKTKIPLTARISDRLNQDLIEYYWNLKTQALLALDNDEQEKKEKYDQLINSFVEKIKKIDNRIEKVEFTADEGKYNIIFKAKEPYENFDFSTLADGYASVFDFVSEIILRMSNETDDIFNLEGIVLIDEPESHLHIEMQKMVIPLLTEFFPNIQFIVATHSPFVLNSISDTVIYDLETQIRVEDFSEVPVHKINEYFFSFSEKFVRQTEKKVDKYAGLIEKYAEDKMEFDRKAELAELDIELQELAPYISHEYFVKFKENQKKLYE